MITENIKFQEQYKRLDSLCKDIFSSKDGVSQYIYAMENTPKQYSRIIDDWDFVYKQLKHYRWIRNQLAHEIGTLESDLCTEGDIEWLSRFYNSILTTNDPLAKVGQYIRKLQEQRNQQKRYTPTYSDINSIAIQDGNTTTTDTKQNEKQKTSLWVRIKSIIRKWFS